MRTAMRKMAAIGLGLGLLLASVTGCSTSGGGASAAAPKASGAWTYDALTYKDLNGQPTPATFHSVDDGAGKGIRACALWPTLKDPWMVGAAQGLYVEAKRTGMGYDLFDAGGYGNLSTQLNQMEDCINSGKYKALILIALTLDGTCNLVKKALAKGMAVMDTVNGTACGEAVTSNPLYSSALVSYYTTGLALADNLTADSRKKKIIALPGPAGVGWSDDMLRGFKEGFAKVPGNDLVDAPRGDTDVTTQLSLAKDSIAANRDVTDIVGSSAGVLGAQSAVREAGIQDHVKIWCTGVNPEILDSVANGSMAGAVADYGPIQLRMAVNDTIRLAKGNPPAYKKVAPKPVALTAESIKSFNKDDIVAANGFKPISSFNP